MDTEFWNLFWMTGMPEAWLMSRGAEPSGPARARPEEETENKPGAPEGVPAGLC